MKEEDELFFPDVKRADVAIRDGYRKLPNIADMLHMTGHAETFFIPLNASFHLYQHNQAVMPPRFP